MKVGYIRVSSKDQKEDRQVKALQARVEKVYIDKLSGKDTNRPQLQELLSFVREGDMVYFESISRLARNTRDFLELMDIFQSKGVSVVCLKEPIDTTTPAGRMMATVFASMYEMERENIRQRQKEGIEIAKEKGVTFGRPKQEITQEFKQLYAKWKANEITARKFMKKVNMKPNTFYRRIKDYEKKRNETEGNEF